MTSAQLDALHRRIRQKSPDRKSDPQRLYGVLCGMALAVGLTPKKRQRNRSTGH
jgi:hypothetical protein